MSNFSVVEFFPEGSGHRCGYCKSPNTNIQSGGLWAHSMSVREYQALIDRGWRRSGHYMYKPCMKRTCCPTYTIRCDVGDLKMLKTQEKVLSKFYKYLRFGDTLRSFRPGAGGDSFDDDMLVDVIPSQMKEVRAEITANELEKIEMDISPSKEGGSSCLTSKSKIPDDDTKGSAGGPGDPNLPCTSLGKKGTQDESEPRPRQRKAKLIRLENKYKKLISRGMTEDEAIQMTYESRKTSPRKKEFCIDGYFLCFEDMSNYTYKFRTELHSVSQLAENPELLQETHKLYSKYQMAVHGDKPDECTMDQLKRFLVKSPLFDSKRNRGPPSGFGSFHQLYWLDERLIAVGVIDILPKCVSSVYFFYDPDLRFLTLGTFGSLHEIYFTRELARVCPTIKYYYLGFYIHSCPKMSYKGRYCPSYLLCPETFTWHRIEKCRLMLSKNKYSRFEEDANVVDQLHCDVDLSKVMILYQNRPMGYMRYKSLNLEADEDDEENVTHYAKLVGEDCYQNIFLFRS